MFDQNQATVPFRRKESLESEFLDDGFCPKEEEEEKRNFFFFLSLSLLETFSLSLSLSLNEREERAMLYDL